MTSCKEKGLLSTLQPVLPAFAWMALMLFAADAQAMDAGAGHGEGGDHHAHIGDLLWPVVNFSMYVGLMLYGYRRLARPVLRDRAVEAREHINRAKRALADAENEHEQLRQRLQDIAHERQAEIERLITEGKRTAAAVRESGQSTAEQIRRDAARRISNEVAKAKADLRAEVVGRATELARQQIAQNLSPSDDARLRTEAVRSIR